MRRALPFLLLIGFAACADSHDTPTEPRFARSGDSPRRESVSVCHRADGGSHLVEAAPAALAAHLAHGDYVARLTVDPGHAGPADQLHFPRITDALAFARAGRLGRSELLRAACRVTIEVVAGTFIGSFDAGVGPGLERFPLLIDVPDLTLRGALRMRVDAGGRATGNGRHAGEVSTLAPDRPLAFMPTTEAMIVVVGHPGGSAGNGTTIEGFSFQSGRSDPGSHGGMGILSLRAADFLVRGNVFGPGLSSAGDFRASSGRVEHNYGNGLGANCAFCLAGPGTYEASGNRLVNGGLGALYVTAAIQHIPFSLGATPVTAVDPDVLPISATVRALLRNNEVRGHLRLPIGFAVRVLGIGPGTATVPQDTHVVLEDNELIGNTFGLIVDAGFPAAGTLRRGDVEVTLRGNVIRSSCQRNLLVAFTRHTGALGLTTNPYLIGSSYRLTLGPDLPWSEAWFRHPAGFGNTLVVDGATIAPGAVTAYDPLAPCP